MTTTRPRNILLTGAAILLVGIVIYAISIEDRIKFYINTRNIAPAPLANFSPQGTPLSPNVNLGFASFYLELSSDATVKKTEWNITIKDQGRTLAINLPEVFSQMQPNPEHPDELQDFDRLIDKYGNIVRAQKASFEFKSDNNVLFCSENDFKCYLSLVLMRLIPMPIYEVQTFHTTPTYDAIIETIRGKTSKIFEIIWTTNQGKRIDQRRGVILMSEKLPIQDANWVNQFIHSMIIHPKGDILSLDEMATRLEKLKQNTAQHSGLSTQDSKK